MTIVYSLIKIHPFGDRSLLMYWDIREQYSNYFVYFKNIFFSNNNFIYSFSKILGGSLIGLTGYYLASPLNILFVILNKMKIVDVILILTLLKIGLCGLTFNIFINYKQNFSFKHLIFSTSYALMAYNIIYQQNIMWLDGVILLPVVCLGIKKIVHEDKNLIYLFSLFAAIFSNYYIGYMIGIFSFLYFMYDLIINNFNIFKNFKECKSKILSFFTATLMSIGLDAFFLIPIITSLEGSKGPTNLLENTTFKDEMFSKNHYIFEKMFKFSDFMSKFFTGAFEWRDVMYGLPFVFCGVGMILLCFLYFFNNLISKKKRIATFMFLLIMFISSNFALINNIWHGFNPPTGFPCRYSFMISFLVICAAYENFLNLNLDKNIIKNSILSIIFIASIFYLKKIGFQHFNSIRAFEANMTINGVEKNFDLANKAIYYLGQYEKGSMLNIKLYPSSKYLYLKSINLYQENVDLLKEYTNYLKQEPCKLEKVSSSHLKGKIEVKSKDKYLFFSIPYEKEWKIKIDGKLCNVAPAFDALMSVPIDPGEHIIDMRYIPKGFYLGLWISLLCAFILLSKYFYKILLKKGMKKDGNDINNRALL